MTAPIAITRVKICCIESLEEARLAIRYGASALGLVSDMPSGPGVISETKIAEIAASVPPGVATFLLTCHHDADAILAQKRRCRTNTVQLVDRVPLDVYPRLRESLPGIQIIQVIHVTDSGSVAEAREVALHVNAILLDSGRPTLPVKELGGTGRVHDWSVSRAIREAVGVPIYLAGGLTPENVAAAVRAVQPFGVDVCTGVRTNGRLDGAKLRAFFAALSRH